MSAPPPIFPMLALGFVNRCVVRTDRPLVTQIVMALSSAARLAGELAGFVPYLCGRHSSACFSTNSPCSSPRIAAPPKYEPKFKRWELANVIGRMGQFCGTNVLSQIDDATQASHSSAKQWAGCEATGRATPQPTSPKLADRSAQS